MHKSIMVQFFRNPADVREKGEKKVVRIVNRSRTSYRKKTTFVLGGSLDRINAEPLADHNF
jgi:translation initiation factor 1 (eIF-1/SUI1)